jgi:hypothetical protein
MATAMHRLIFPERVDFGDLVGMVTATPRGGATAMLVWWEVTIGAPPPPCPVPSRRQSQRVQRLYLFV